MVIWVPTDTAFTGCNFAFWSGWVWLVIFICFCSCKGFNTRMCIHYCRGYDLVVGCSPRKGQLRWEAFVGGSSCYWQENRERRSLLWRGSRKHIYKLLKFVLRTVMDVPAAPGW
ncbi:uncharacterized protein B0H64DRAFT_404418 [Chaetomium fimeti]|uniref:Uncharacterized protein n=1 Tax=Chaetomium fimeti TaxID=1854472 RepID=A0AAE0LQ61_9PEZI|nr:hypothetical protein B0H64DRAFT_404418 [Chaetomium fimeti]